MSELTYEVSGLIDSLSAAVARLLAESGRERVRLGDDGGTIVEVGSDGQVAVNGVPCGEPDTGYNWSGALQEIDA